MDSVGSCSLGKTGCDAMAAIVGVELIVLRRRVLLPKNIQKKELLYAIVKACLSGMVHSF